MRVGSRRRAIVSGTRDADIRVSTLRSAVIGNAKTSLQVSKTTNSSKVIRPLFELSATRNTVVSSGQSSDPRIEYCCLEIRLKPSSVGATASIKELGSRYLPSALAKSKTHLIPSVPSLACRSNILLHRETSLSGLATVERSVSESLEASGFCSVSDIVCIV
jgi:hypothetical protein